MQWSVVGVAARGLSRGSNGAPKLRRARAGGQRGHRLTNPSSLFTQRPARMDFSCRSRLSRGMAHGINATPRLMHAAACGQSSEPARRWRCAPRGVGLRNRRSQVRILSGALPLAANPLQSAGLLRQACRFLNTRLPGGAHARRQRTIAQTIAQQRRPAAQSRHSRPFVSVRSARAVDDRFDILRLSVSRLSTRRHASFV
jgi:hypothetical protein